MDHKNKFKNKAGVIKYVLQVLKPLKRTKEFLPLSLPHEVILRGTYKRLKLVTKVVQFYSTSAAKE